MSCVAPRCRGETRDSERSMEKRKKKDGFEMAMPLHRGQRPVCSRGVGFGSRDGSSCSALSGLFVLHQQAPGPGAAQGSVQAQGYPGQEVIGGGKAVMVSCPLYLCVQRKAETVMAPLIWSNQCILVSLCQPKAQLTTVRAVPWSCALCPSSPSYSLFLKRSLHCLFSLCCDQGKERCSVVLYKTWSVGTSPLL